MAVGSDGQANPPDEAVQVVASLRMILSWKARATGQQKAAELLPLQQAADSDTSDDMASEGDDKF